eukprot:scaffold5833_cov165-Amphora_coffeaeformis.AAC.5
MDQNLSSGQGDAVGRAMRVNEQSSAPGSLVHPTADDIILGRGSLHASHPGNVRFYSIIDQHIPTYNAAQTRTDKTQVVQTIYDILTKVARFVKEDPPSAACVVIDEKESKKKISHAIRYRRRPDKATGRRTRSHSPPSRTGSPRQRPQRQSTQQQQQQQQQQPRQVPQQRHEPQSQYQPQTVQQMRQHRSGRSDIQPIQLPPLQQPIQLSPVQQPVQFQFPPMQQAMQFVPMQQPTQFPPHQQIRQLQEEGLQILPPSDPSQQGQEGGGSPLSLFGDGELESVLLPPEVMASARMPYEEFLGEEFEDVTDRSSPRDHER